mmetsp:Transcript_18740/g.28466  ORF Transcript_18740/g.28466 Transcript_18740/m.28466 type:complete len:267 (-) Transcript_18740:86-886(-)
MYDDDDNSVNSSASSVHEAITSATDLRKDRLRRIRESRRQHARSACCKKMALENLDDSSVRSANSIMTVRTLDESLNGCTVAKMRKLRRKVQVKFKTAVHSGDEMLADTSICSGDESLFSHGSQSTAVSALQDISLTFNEVMIREYEVVPGCNPCISEGPPVELGWQHTEAVIHSLDLYEKIRPSDSRRLQCQMRMPQKIREELLILHGSNPKEIKTAMKSALITKKQRASTAFALESKGEHHDEMMESLKKGIFKPFRRKPKQKK